MRTLIFLVLLSNFLFGQIIISEIMQNPAAVSDTYGEWFEVFNPTNSPIDIDGWTIKDNGSNNHVINNGGPLFVPSEGFIILGRNSDESLNGGVNIDYVYSSFTLGNTDDEIILLDGSNNEIDRVEYDDGLDFPSPTGSSMYFSGGPSDDNNVGSNWLISTISWSGSAGDNGSPGEQGEGLLPVELTTFSANITEKNVNLNWETATEVNNYGFNIERKHESGEWNKLGFVEGHGNSNSPKFYNYKDKSLKISGKYLYRLKQIDIDGSFEYSHNVEINFDVPIDYSLDQNYPNPFNPTTSIQFTIPADCKVKLSVFNLLGEKVAELANKNFAAGYHRVDFNASNLNSGIYFYSLDSGDFHQIRKMCFLK